MRPKHIVILGGGFGGVALANALARGTPARTRVTVLSEESFLLYSPLLSEVVGGSLLPAHAVAPIRQLLHGTSFHRVHVTGVDLEERRVVFQGGPGHLDFDDLVLACGLRFRLDLIPGMAEHGFPLRGIGDALELRNRVLLQLERAELETDAARRHRLMRFAVVGGGASGVETAGAINDFLRTACRHYPALDPAGLGVSLVHAGGRLLDELSPQLGHFAHRHMERRGVDVRLGRPAEEVTAEGVRLAHEGGLVEAGTVVCALGTRPVSLVHELGLQLSAGRVRTRPDLSVPGHPGLWALGDCAAVPNAAEDGAVCPPMAQFAVRQARHLAGNLERASIGGTSLPFSYRPRALLATIGHRRAVARLYGVNVQGIAAWLLWRAVYLAKLPTWLRRFQVFFEWSWQALFPQDVTQFDYSPARLADGRPFRPAGDVGAGPPAGREGEPGPVPEHVRRVRGDAGSDSEEDRRHATG